jgi:predicted phosphodiesterase
VTLAILYDIHGNLPALEAVLEDASGAGVRGFILGGDYALFGPFPSETVARLRSLDGEVTWIRGNVDRWCFDPNSAPDDEVLRGAIGACRGALGDVVVAELGMLGQQMVIEGTRFCHASPLSDLQSFMPSPADAEDELLAGAEERRIVFGHTHLPFRRVRDDGVELFNPGSVGFPFDGDDRAAYALMHGDGSLEHRRVAYDVSSAAAALSDRFEGAAWASRSVKWLQDARR